jgi:hypothetical protein
LTDGFHKYPSFLGGESFRSSPFDFDGGAHDPSHQGDFLAFFPISALPSSIGRPGRIVNKNTLSTKYERFPGFLFFLS